MRLLTRILAPAALLLALAAPALADPAKTVGGEARRIGYWYDPPPRWVPGPPPRAYRPPPPRYYHPPPPPPAYYYPPPRAYYPYPPPPRPRHYAPPPGVGLYFRF